jgi:hypothetical protein
VDVIGVIIAGIIIGLLGKFFAPGHRDNIPLWLTIVCGIGGVLSARCCGDARHRLDPVDHQHRRRGRPRHDRGLGDGQTRQGDLTVLGPNLWWATATTTRATRSREQ